MATGASNGLTLVELCELQRRIEMQGLDSLTSAERERYEATRPWREQAGRAMRAELPRLRRLRKQAEHPVFKKNLRDWMRAHQRAPQRRGGTRRVARRVTAGTRTVGSRGDPHPPGDDDDLDHKARPQASAEQHRFLKAELDRRRREAIGDGRLRASPADYALFAADRE